MSLLGDVREVLETAPTRGDGCKICEPWYQEAHRPGCPYGLLLKIVAVLEAAERLTKEMPVRGGSGGYCYYCLGGKDREHAPDCPWGALKEPA